MIQEVRTSSLETFERLTNYLGECQILIYKHITEHAGLTRKEISLDTNLPIENVTGRVKDLLNLGLIREGEKRQCSITKNNVNTIYSINNIDWCLLDIKRKQKRQMIKINKKHISTIYMLIDFVEKKVGSKESFNYLLENSNEPSIKSLLELKETIDQVSTKLTNEMPFFMADCGYAIIFKASSETRGKYHEIEYNKLNNKISCSCEDYKFRHRKCKHIEKVIKKFNIEVKDELKR